MNKVAFEFNQFIYKAVRVEGSSTTGSKTIVKTVAGTEVCVCAGLPVCVCVFIVGLQFLRVFPLIHPSHPSRCCRCFIQPSASFMKTSCGGKTKGRMLHFSAAKNGSIVTLHISHTFHFKVNFELTMLGSDCCAHFHGGTRLLVVDGHKSRPTCSLQSAASPLSVCRLPPACQHVMTSNWDTTSPQRIWTVRERNILFFHRWCTDTENRWYRV